MRTRRREWMSIGLTPVLALAAAIGLVLVALGNNAARSDDAVAWLPFWTGLVLIYAPIAWRLLAAETSRRERIALVVLLSVSLFLVKVLYSPNEFVFYDELGWWRATNDLLNSGGPFSSNPLVITTEAFPGLDLLTGPLVALAHLSIFDAGTITVGLTRTAFLFALFLFFERATHSSRAAGIGVLVYACNPSFLYFNSQFAYESVALLIGVSLLLATIRWSDARDPAVKRGVRSLITAIAILAFTLTITHHITTYAVLALLIAWALFMELGEEGRGSRRGLLETPALTAVILAAMGGAWFVFVAGDLTITEAGDQVTGSLTSAWNVVFGDSETKKPFEAGAQTNSTPARIAAVISVLALLGALVAGFVKTWRPSVRDGLQRALMLLGLGYVVTLGLRATQGGTETSQRASEFVFLGIGFLAAMAIASWLGSRPSGRLRLGLTCLGTVVFLGGFIIGEPPQGRQPGPFLISAERRSVSPEGLAAAEFAGRSLRPGSRILVDHANATLMASYGGLDPVRREVDGVPISRVFFDPRFDRPARRVVLNGNIRYIVVDRRLSRSIPVQGSYYAFEEPLSFERRRPISRQALGKFSGVRGLTKVYANGPIEIYDTFGLRTK
jgi:hypothetical protein